MVVELRLVNELIKAYFTRFIVLTIILEESAEAFLIHNLSTIVVFV